MRWHEYEEAGMGIAQLTEAPRVVIVEEETTRAPRPPRPGHQLRHLRYRRRSHLGCAQRVLRRQWQQVLEDAVRDRSDAAPARAAEYRELLTYGIGLGMSSSGMSWRGGQ